MTRKKFEVSHPAQTVYKVLGIVTDEEDATLRVRGWAFASKKAREALDKARERRMRNEYGDEELKEIIEAEGLGYAITDYMNPQQISDPKTKDLWQDAYDALLALRMHLHLDD